MSRRKRGKRSPHVPFGQSTAPADDQPRDFRLHHGKSDLWTLAGLTVFFVVTTAFTAAMLAWEWTQLVAQIVFPILMLVVIVRCRDEPFLDAHVPALAGAISLALVAYAVSRGDGNRRHAVVFLAGILWLVVAGVAWSTRRR